MVPWAVKLLFLTALVGSTWADDEQNFDMHFEGVETVDGSDSFFRYNYTVDKKSETAFTVSGFISQLTLLDNGYGLQMKLSRANLDAPEPLQYEEMLGIEKPICEYLTTVYRMYFYDQLKDISNFPHYDTCPLEPTDYWFKDYSFDGEDYKAFMRDGHFKMELYLTKGEETVAGVVSKMRVEPATANE